MFDIKYVSGRAPEASRDEKNFSWFNAEGCVYGTSSGSGYPLQSFCLTLAGLNVLVVITLPALQKGFPLLSLTHHLFI